MTGEDNQIEAKLTYVIQNIFSANCHLPDRRRIFIWL